ncbi:F-box domain-containing protein [Caenorhabditis elegans]|uniref:F-box domain-containing protein n=1 Tax=Caenorhabditis elegans TaxID=6239 RepID=Q95XB6_CAEEL|nr:F-box domain-containing protein [Caenorhabditis elegans]CCD73893.1 F-box domain-containing protein [Caenorhabditis elegans]|eukprot:NP_497386.2 F-box A protein [Caenorhabditis elegans]
MSGCFIDILPKWISSSSNRQKNLQQESPLLSIPLDVANQVLEKLEPMDLWTCRNVCQGLRRAVDGFGIHFDTIVLSIHDSGICITLDNNTIDYDQLLNDEGTSVVYKKQEKIFKKQNYVKVAVKDFGILLRYASKLHISSVHTCYKTDMYFTAKHLLRTLTAKKWNHVEKLEFWKVPLDFVLSILPHFKSQGLESIILWNTYLWDDTNNLFEQITKLDQWKNTKNFRFDNYELECPPFEHLFHFQTFKIHILKFSVENAIQFRDDLLKRKTFEKCAVKIGITNESVDPSELSRVFKSDYNGESDFEYSNDLGRFAIYCQCSRLFIKRC